MTTLNNGWGSTQFPLATGAVLLHADLDPGAVAIGEFIQAVVNAELSTQWQQSVSLLPEEHILNNTGAPRQPIRTILYLETAIQTLQQVKAYWPVLCVYRTGEVERSDISLAYPATKQRWALDWLTGPLDIDQVLSVGAFAHPINRAIRTALVDGRHPDYNGGCNPFYGHFVSIEVVGQNGPGTVQNIATGTDGGVYGVTLILETVERYVQNFGGSQFEIDTGHVETGDGYATTFVDATVDVDNEEVDTDIDPPT